MAGINIGTLVGGASLEDQLSSALDQISKRLDATGVSFQQINAKVQMTGSVMNQAANVQANLQSELAKTQNNLGFLKAAMDTQAEIINKYGDRTGKLGAALNTVSKDFLETKSQADALNKCIVVLDDTFKKFEGDFKVTGNQVVAVGRGLQGAGIVMSTAITPAIVGASAAAMKFGGDFEKAMTKASVLGGLTAQEMESFRKPILALATDFGIVPDQVALGMDIIGSAMMKGKQAMDTLTVSSKMSALGMGT